VHDVTDNNNKNSEKEYHVLKKKLRVTADEFNKYVDQQQLIKAVD
jgi:hypothetical protein